MIVFSILQGSEVTHFDYNTNSLKMFDKIRVLTDKLIYNGTLFEEKTDIKVLATETSLQQDRKFYSWKLLVNGKNKISVFLEYEEI